MRNSRHHLGIDIEVWTAQQTWFWLALSPHGSGGMIGVAATEAEAVREACLSIEATSAQRQADAAVLRVTATNASMPTLHQFNSMALFGWESSLANLERHLAYVCDATG
jgi:hypothetical protein